MSQIARVRTTLSGLEGGIGLSTAYFAGPGDIDAPTALEGAKRVRAMWAAMVAYISVGVTLQVQAQVDVLTAETGVLAGSFGVTPQSSVVGSNANTPLSGQDQMLIRLITGAVTGGKRVAGRINVPGACTNDMGSGGLLTSTVVTGLSTDAALLNTLITTACSNVVWHRPKAGAGGAAFLVTSYAGQAKLATLRSRRD